VWHLGLVACVLDVQISRPYTGLQSRQQHGPTTGAAHCCRGLPPRAQGSPPSSTPTMPARRAPRPAQPHACPSTPATAPHANHGSSVCPARPPARPGPAPCAAARLPGRPTRRACPHANRHLTAWPLQPCPPPALALHTVPLACPATALHASHELCRPAGLRPPAAPPTAPARTSHTPARRPKRPLCTLQQQRWSCSCRAIQQLRTALRSLRQLRQPSQHQLLHSKWPCTWQQPHTICPITMSSIPAVSVVSDVSKG
jgi:hypothetical protein